MTLWPISVIDSSRSRNSIPSTCTAHYVKVHSGPGREGRRHIARDEDCSEGNTHDKLSSEPSHDQGRAIDLGAFVQQAAPLLPCGPQRQR
jgi:hypothetical protein